MPDMTVMSADRLREASRLANSLPEKRMSLNQALYRAAREGNTSAEFDVHNMTSEDRMSLRDEIVSAGLTGQITCKDRVWVIRWA